MLAFNTSYYYDRVSLKVVSKKIIIEKLPNFLQDKSIMIVITDSSDNIVLQSLLELPETPEVSWKNIPDGDYFLNIYHNIADKENRYWPYLQNRSVALRIYRGRMQFVESPIASENRRVLSELLCDYRSLKTYIEPTYLYQCNAIEIKTLADKITKFKVTPMQKLLAIHDWVAENIYYDRDALNSLECRSKDYSALEVLLNNKCVCRGFANLGVALMRASNIPSIGIPCYALNISAKGGWEKKENHSHSPNHIIAAAYVSNRWILMDITWDSDNIFENGKFTNITEIGCSRKYFDTTVEMISNTHKLMTPFYGEYIFI